MIRENVERRWSVSLSPPGEETNDPVLTVNSIDGDPKSVKVSVGGSPGRREAIVPVADLIDLLKRVAANTNGVPSGV